MDNMSLLNVIKEEGINTLNVFSHDNGKVYGAYICTLKASEVELGERFTDQFELRQTWNVRYTSTGYVEKTWDYEIFDKYHDKVVFTQN